MTCPNCGLEASGNFCSHCGASLGGTACPSCGHTPPAGARFCNKCGAGLAAGAPAPQPRPASRPAPTQAAARGETSNQGGLWAIAGTIGVGALLIALFPIFSPTDKNTEEAPPGLVGTPPAGAATGRSSVDLSSMTPEQAADRLYNRVMQAGANGDEAQVMQFLPMAIAAHEIIPSPDIDRRYHLAALQRTAGQYDASLATAEAALEEVPNHLLHLAAAAEASLGLGDSASARAFYQRMLDVWDEEMASGRPEYLDHENYWPIMRDGAAALLGG